MDSEIKLISNDLLSLILEEDVELVDVGKPDEHSLRYNSVKMEDGKVFQYFLNMDTLVKLLKEWCVKQGYFLENSFLWLGIGYYRLTIKDFGSKTVCVYDTSLGANFLKTHKIPEFEAVSKATEWVAKEKGFLDG